MGIRCEINLFKRTDSAFVPGETVSGIIKYAVDKDIAVTQTIVSLKGIGFLRVKDRRKQKKNRNPVFTNSEQYVDIDHVLQEDAKRVLTYGQYETSFRFKMPEDIPSSFSYEDSHSQYSIRCYITYYVRIKFERPGLFQFNKHFRKEINVVADLKPRLPTSPSIFGEQKKLFQPFVKKTSIVTIKTSVESCVVQPGGKIELNYEIVNDTNVIIRSVETKLKEVQTFKTRTHPEIVVTKAVPYTEIKTTMINSGESQNMMTIINVPSNVTSIERSKLVSRDYFVKITAQLPMPHFNAALKIPVQIGDVICDVPLYSDPPPSYWEAMGEHEEKGDEE